MTCTSGKRLNQVAGRHMVSNRDTCGGKAGRNRHVTLAYVTPEMAALKGEKKWLEQIRLAPLSNIYVVSRPRVLKSVGLL